MKKTNLKYIRMFFMGVLGWPPSVVMREADLEELADAYEGYARFHGLFTGVASYPSAQFLSEMLRKFPDREGA